MGYVVGRRTSKEEAEKLVLFYGEHYEQVDSEDQAAGKITFFLRPLIGRDEVKLSDHMIQINRKTRATVMLTGTVNREKCVCAVIAVEGLEQGDGTPVERFTPEVYNGLETWITDALLAKVNEAKEAGGGEQGE